MIKVNFRVTDGSFGWSSLFDDGQPLPRVGETVQHVSAPTLFAVVDVLHRIDADGECCSVSVLLRERTSRMEQRR